MIRSRTILSVAAFAALAAWANAQAMACCWLPEALASVRAVIEESVQAPESMAANHSCCPGTKGADSDDSAPSTEPMPGCGMDAHGVTSLCCDSGESALVSSNSAIAPDVAMGAVIRTGTLLEAVYATMPPQTFVLSSPPDGSPPFLTFQRLLI
jgi:hypothetical protein